MSDRLPPCDPDAPVRFLCPLTWELGEYRRFKGRFRVYVVNNALTVDSLPPRGFRPLWSVTFPDAVLTVRLLSGGAVMASKWIAAAVVKKGKASKVTGGDDPFLFKGRPALRDFMAELLGADGLGREPSVLMVAASDDGVRVGLKDSDADGWVWRVGDTMAEALDAIEKALQAGNVRWSSSQAARRKR